MVYKLAHGAEIDSLPFRVSGKLYDNLLEFLLVLDNEYGPDRDVEQDGGGYVLFCTPNSTVIATNIFLVSTFAGIRTNQKWNG